MKNSEELKLGGITINLLSIIKDELEKENLDEVLFANMAYDTNHVKKVIIYLKDDNTGLSDKEAKRLTRLLDNVTSGSADWTNIIKYYNIEVTAIKQINRVKPILVFNIGTNKLDALSEAANSLKMDETNVGPLPYPPFSILNKRANFNDFEGDTLSHPFHIGLVNPCNDTDADLLKIIENLIAEGQNHSCPVCTPCHNGKATRNNASEELKSLQNRKNYSPFISSPRGVMDMGGDLNELRDALDSLKRTMEDYVVNQNRPIQKNKEDKSGAISDISSLVFGDNVKVNKEYLSFNDKRMFNILYGPKYDELTYTVILNKKDMLRFNKITLAPAMVPDNLSSEYAYNVLHSPETEVRPITLLFPQSLYKVFTKVDKETKPTQETTTPLQNNGFKGYVNVSVSGMSQPEFLNRKEYGEKQVNDGNMKPEKIAEEQTVKKANEDDKDCSLLLNKQVKFKEAAKRHVSTKLGIFEYAIGNSWYDEVYKVVAICKDADYKDKWVLNLLELKSLKILGTRLTTSEVNDFFKIDSVEPTDEKPKESKKRKPKKDD